MPRKFESPIAVPTTAFDGLETVQDLRQASMLHYRAVQDLVNRLGYPETALWAQENRHEYLVEGASRGFLVAE